MIESFFEGDDFIKLLELTSDVVFKSFMLSEATTNFKARLLHQITNIPEDDLKKATYESSELSGDSKFSKVYRTDIIVRIAKHIINIEMNNDYYEGVIEKNESYLNKISSEQFIRGDSYTNISKIIQINFDNYKHYSGGKLLYKFMMMEEDTHELESEFIESYHIDLTYLNGKCYNELNELEKSCFVFLEEQEETTINSLRGDSVMDEAYDELERISRDTGIIGLYDAEKVERKVYNSKMNYAEKIGMEKGMQEGMEKGMQEGMEKGIKKGIKQGIEQGIEQGLREGEHAKTIEIAKEMLKENIDINIISKVTNLSISEINSL